MPQNDSLYARVNKYAISLVDNAITKSIAFVVWSIPLYFYLSPYFSFLQSPNNTDYENIKQFIEWFGVPYGLLLALVMVNAWTQFETVKREFDREADTIWSFYDTVDLVTNQSETDILKKKIKDYVDLVIKHFEEETVESESGWRRDGYKILDDIRRSVGKLIEDKQSDVITSELLALVNQVVAARGNRLDSSRERIPSPILWISIIASFLWLVPFYLLRFEDAGLGMFFVGGVTFVVVSILLIIVDLNNPIDEGTWSVNLDSWNALKSRLDKPST
ncbi:MAG: hypothetical protein U0V48_04580 [Anaerolineales bacterium]